MVARVQLRWRARFIRRRRSIHTCYWVRYTLSSTVWRFLISISPRSAFANLLIKSKRSFINALSSLKYDIAARVFPECTAHMFHSWLEGVNLHLSWSMEMVRDRRVDENEFTVLRYFHSPHLRCTKTSSSCISNLVSNFAAHYTRTSYLLNFLYWPVPCATSLALSKVEVIWPDFWEKIGRDEEGEWPERVFGVLRV